MAARLTAGAAVQTPFGKGVVREVRNAGRLLVEVQGRSLVLQESEVQPIDSLRVRRPSKRPAEERSGNVPQRSGNVAQRSSAENPPSTAPEIDLHGLRVEEALARADEALDRALLDGAAELRIIHGRSGGRIRGAVHAWLKKMPGVSFRVDPRNEGVTIVSL